MKLSKLLFATSALVMLPVIALSFSTDAAAATKAKSKAPIVDNSAPAAAPVAAAPADPFADFSKDSLGYALVKAPRGLICAIAMKTLIRMGLQKKHSLQFSAPK